MDVIFVLVIFYYTAGGARCKGEQGENARNMSESADEEGHTAQKQMEIIGFLTKAGERLRGEAGPAGRIPGACRGLRRGKFRRGLPHKKLRRGKLCLNNSTDMMILSA